MKAITEIRDELVYSLWKDLGIGTTKIACVMSITRKDVNTIVNEFNKGKQKRLVIRNTLI